METTLTRTRSCGVSDLARRRQAAKARSWKGGGRAEVGPHAHRGLGTLVGVALHFSDFALSVRISRGGIAPDEPVFCALSPAGTALAAPSTITAAEATSPVRAPPPGAHQARPARPRASPTAAQGKLAGRRSKTPVCATARPLPMVHADQDAHRVGSDDDVGEAAMATVGSLGHVAVINTPRRLLVMCSLHHRDLKDQHHIWNTCRRKGQHPGSRCNV